MAYEHNITFTCDYKDCEKNFMIDETMELPPHWIGMQVAIGNKEGEVIENEQNIFAHFCSIECTIKYLSSTNFKNRYFSVDKPRDRDYE